MTLQTAVDIEATGDFQAALDAYRQIDLAAVSAPDALYVRRSIAACLFYLKDYPSAERAFLDVLESPVDEAREEVTNCLHLCYLYGGKPELARSHFLSQSSDASASLSSQMWANWYLGQSFTITTDFGNGTPFYRVAWALSAKGTSDSLAFFFAHYLVCLVQSGQPEEARRELALWDATEEMDGSFGLLKIVRGVLLRAAGTSSWKETFDAGMVEATREKYVENVVLGNELIEKYP